MFHKKHTHTINLPLKELSATPQSVNITGFQYEPEWSNAAVEQLVICYFKIILKLC